mgnify:CR=1 FL=1
MKILLLGSNGQLGYEAARTLFCFGELVAVDYPEIDFTKPNDIVKLINEVKPDLIYNAVAYTDVDKAEIESEKSMLVNCYTPGEIAIYCKKFNIPLIHFSTDYVFDGKKGELYTEEDIPNPVNVYGRSKLAGEQAILQSNCPGFIFRTSWVYSLRAGGFVKKVIDWAKKNEELKIVNDQIGNPTWARTLAILSTNFFVGNLSEDYSFDKGNSGVYHLAGGGFTTRFDWSKTIIENLPNEYQIITKSIVPGLTSDFSSLASRPLFSALNCSKFENTFNVKIPDWKIATKLMLEK